VEHAFSVTTYIVVCAALIVLTVLTVGISFIPLQSSWHLVFGLSIAAVKATLVVLVFMHAAISPKQVWLVIVVSCFWFSILLVLTMADYINRDLVPYMPGH
jgi:cytochrome c oxidase subunit IV